MADTIQCTHCGAVMRPANMIARHNAQKALVINGAMLIEVT